MDEIVDRYNRRAEHFRALILGARADGWSDPSPCADWDAREVVAHIVDMHSYTLRPLGHELSPAPDVRDDPLGAFDSARADVQALLADEVASTTWVETPEGQMSVREQVDRMVSEDMVWHAWDLAKATGQDATLAEEDVRRLWEALRAVPAEVLERYRTPDAFGPGVVVFGPEFVVPADAPLQDRLLGMAGRDPQWTQA